jgi:hypothetical protein
MTSLRISLCRAVAAHIALASRSQSRVLPSMSVKRNVTIPLGSPVMNHFPFAYGHRNRVS